MGVRGSQAEAKFWKRTEGQNSLEVVAGEISHHVRARIPCSRSAVCILGAHKCFSMNKSTSR